jgi:hypothetical protein
MKIRTHRWTELADGSRNPSVTEALQETVRIKSQERQRALVGRMPGVFTRVSEQTPHNLNKITKVTASANLHIFDRKPWVARSRGLFYQKR